MDKKDALLKKLRAGSFIENNGTVLRDINLLRHQYIDLKSVRRVRSDRLNEQEFLDCINYLSQAGYIDLRDTASKQEARLADTAYTALEAIVTAKGIRLLGGAMSDDMVDV